MVLMVLRVEHIVACKLGCKCKRKRGGKARETKRWRDRDRAKETWTPNTYALARTTLKITIGCPCQGSSACADGARSESAATPRLRPFRSRPRLHSFAASADVTRLEHHDAAARASSWCCPATSLAASHAFRVVFGPPRATGAAEQRLALSSQRHDPRYAKVPTRERSKEEIENYLSNHHNHNHHHPHRDDQLTSTRRAKCT